VHGRGNPLRHREAVEHLLAIVGLADRIDYLPGNLSGGQKQRVAIARALVANPEIVFADEPTAALDKVSGMAMVRLLKDLGRSRGTTTVMVTHDPRILDLADRIITLEDGALVAADSEPPLHPPMVPAQQAPRLN
jgi:putative ABC transport system ATP-binding protein